MFRNHLIEKPTTFRARQLFPFQHIETKARQTSYRQEQRIYLIYIFQASSFEAIYVILNRIQPTFILCCPYIHSLRYLKESFVNLLIIPQIIP